MTWRDSSRKGWRCTLWRTTRRCLRSRSPRWILRGDDVPQPGWKVCPGGAAPAQRWVTWGQPGAGHGAIAAAQLPRGIVALLQ